MRFDPQSNYVNVGEEPVVPVRDGSWRPVSVVLGMILLVVLVVAGSIYAWLWHVDGSPPPVVPVMTAVPSVETGETRELLTWTMMSDRLVAGGEEPAPEPAPPSREAFEIGQSLLAMGRPSEAVPHLSAAVDADPADADAHYRLGMAYMLSGDVAAAEREQLALSELDASLSSLLGNLIR